MTPHEFLENFVDGNHNDFKKHKDCLRRGFNAALATFHLVDHYYYYHKKHNSAKMSRFPKREDYLKYLSTKSKYFNDIQSIANVYKHLYEKKIKDHVTVASAGSITVEILRPKIRIEADENGEFAVFYTRMRTGDKVDLSIALKDVIEMLRNEIG